MQPTFAAVNIFSISKAHEAQMQLSHKIIKGDQLPQKIRFVAGVDVAYFGKFAIGAVAVLNYETFDIIEKQAAKCEAKFPYIPTLLSFREIPPALACIKKLRQQPDVLLVDGHGVAHPYGCGLASHLGLALGKPTVGVAKKRLIGETENIAGKKLLFYKDQIVGAVVTTKKGAKPVYVSIGHLISLGTAVKIAKHCVRNSKIPEPILQAHKVADMKKLELQEKSKPL